MLALSEMNRDLASFGGALAATLLLTPLAIRLARGIGLVDRPGPHKFHRDPIPYLGGLAILVAAQVALLTGGHHRSLALELPAIGVGAILVASIGLVDDWLTIGAAPRLTVQALAATGLWIARIRLEPTRIAALNLGVTVLVVLTVTNAMNLLDNMDGLAAGTAAIASFFFFVAAIWQGQHLVSLMAIVITGACLGFLPYNFRRAQVFLGDSGALFLGFLLATILIKLNASGYPLITRSVVPLLIVAVPIFDMTLVVLSRIRGHRRVFRGSTDHSSHRLVALGASPAQVALTTYLAGAAAGGLALALLRAHSSALSWTAAIVSLAVGCGLLWFFERASTRAMVPVASTPAASSGEMAADAGTTSSQLAAPSKTVLADA